MPRAKCRFDETHTFSNPVELRKHYEQEHSHEWQPSPNPKVRCVVDGCNRIVRRSGLYAHLNRAHNGRTSIGAWVEVDQDLPVSPREPWGHKNQANMVEIATTNGHHRPRSTDLERCNVCGFATFRRNMAKHFLRSHHEQYHTWSSHVTRVDESQPSRAMEMAELVAVETVERTRTFAVRPDGHDYSTDDFWLPVVHELARPDGVVPVEAMQALGRFRDDVTVMLHAVSNLQPTRRK